ncbi:MAG TPA: DUF2238 domain-containing protein [Halobacteria archaeon]|jgi:hypothetical protein|nr:DUF2238 domain-containing protein [Halobacteria archaeon]
MAGKESVDLDDEKNNLDVRREKIRSIVGQIPSYFIQALILVYIISSFLNKDYLWGVWGIFGFFLTILPLILKKSYSISLPWELNFLIFFPLLLHMGGTVREWYDLFYPFYDKFAHLISSMAVAVFGFISVIIIDHYVESIKIENKYFLAFFVVIFTVTMGVFWEIGEFLSDMFFMTNTQPSLADTMWDLIVDLAGGVIIAVLGTYYSTNVSRERFLDKFKIERNETEKEIHDLEHQQKS